jgi:hypothetical protein
MQGKTNRAKRTTNDGNVIEVVAVSSLMIRESCVEMTLEVRTEYLVSSTETALQWR